MRLIQKTVHYCCVWRGNQVLYSYSGGNREIEDLADLCIDKTPPFHSWYFETYHGRTFGFLIEEGCVYFAIFDDSFSKQGVLQFLSNLKDEFKRVARKVSKGNLSRINATALQDRLAPAIRRLITSLEQTSLDWPIEIRALDHGNLSPSPINMTGQQVESTSSTKAPLLGRNNNPDKKKNKDHVVAMRDIEMEPCKSTDKGVRTESSSQDSSVQKDPGLVKNRSLSRSPSARKKWWRQVRIVLAIDVAVCAVLFIIWLTICLHTDCMR